MLCIEGKLRISIIHGLGKLEVSSFQKHTFSRLLSSTAKESFNPPYCDSTNRIFQCEKNENAYISSVGVGRGRGLFAKRKIAKGEIILGEEATYPLVAHVPNIHHVQPSQNPSNSNYVFCPHCYLVKAKDQITVDEKGIWECPKSCKYHGTVETETPTATASESESNPQKTAPKSSRRGALKPKYDLEGEHHHLFLQTIQHKSFLNLIEFFDQGGLEAKRSHSPNTGTSSSTSTSTASPASPAAAAAAAPPSPPSSIIDVDELASRIAGEKEKGEAKGGTSSNSNGSSGGGSGSIYEPAAPPAPGGGATGEAGAGGSAPPQKFPVMIAKYFARVCCEWPSMSFPFSLEMMSVESLQSVGKTTTTTKPPPNTTHARHYKEALKRGQYADGTNLTTNPTTNSSSSSSRRRSSRDPSFPTPPSSLAFGGTVQQVNHPPSWEIEYEMIQEVLDHALPTDKRQYLTILPYETYVSLMLKLHLNAFELRYQPAGDGGSSGNSRSSGGEGGSEGRGEGEGMGMGMGLYLIPSMMNHSCQPNVTITYAPTTTTDSTSNADVADVPGSFPCLTRPKFVATRDVGPGEELLVEYIDTNSIRKSFQNEPYSKGEGSASSKSSSSGSSEVGGGGRDRIASEFVRAYLIDHYGFDCAASASASASACSGSNSGAGGGDNGGGGGNGGPSTCACFGGGGSNK